MRESKEFRFPSWLVVGVGRGVFWGTDIGVLMDVVQKADVRGDGVIEGLRAVTHSRGVHDLDWHLGWIDGHGR